MQPGPEILAILKRYELHEPVSREDKETLHRWLDQAVHDIEVCRPSLHNPRPLKTTQPRTRKRRLRKIAAAVAILIIMMIAVMFAK